MKAKQWEYLAADVRRRSEALYRAWAARSRNDGATGEEAVPAAAVRRVGPRPVRAWYARRAAEAGLAAALVLAVWGGAAVWRSVTRQAIQRRLSGLSTAALRADGQAAGSFYGSTLVRFQNSYDVPHEKVAQAVAQVFRDYPFVIHYAYSNPVFESVWPGEVSLLVDREWELRGNDIYSGSERHRLIWKREDGEWRIVSQELIRTNWSRKTTPGVDAAGGATAIGVH